MDLLGVQWWQLAGGGSLQSISFVHSHCSDASSTSRDLLLLLLLSWLRQQTKIWLG